MDSYTRCVQCEAIWCGESGRRRGERCGPLLIFAAHLFVLFVFLVVQTVKSTGVTTQWYGGNSETPLDGCHQVALDANYAFVLTDNTIKQIVLNNLDTTTEDVVAGCVDDAPYSAITVDAAGNLYAFHIPTGSLLMWAAGALGGPGTVQDIYRQDQSTPTVFDGVVDGLYVDFVAGVAAKYIVFVQSGATETADISKIGQTVQDSRDRPDT
jgi:hypothetical protein